MVLALPVKAEEKPPFDFQAEPHEAVGYEAFNWLPKDYGWLLTFRFTSTSRYAIKPITHLRFEAYNDGEEVIWTDSQVVRRKDMDSVLGKGDSQFVRVLVKNLPKETKLVKMRFDDGKGEAAE